MSLEKQMTDSEWVASRFAAELEGVLPAGVEVSEVVYDRGWYRVECDGINSVLDLIDVAAEVNAGITLTANGDRQHAVLRGLLWDSQIVIREEFDLPEGSGG